MEQNKYLFKYLSAKHFFFLLSISILNAVLFSFNSQSAIRGELVACILCLGVIDPLLCLGIYITSNLYIGAVFTGTMQVLIKVYISLMLFRKNYKMIHHLKYGIFFLASIATVIISYCTGIDSNGNVAILMLNIIFMIEVLANLKTDDIIKNIPMLVWAYVCCAISMSMYTGLSMIMSKNTAQVYGRIAFDGDIKTLATVMAVGIAILLCSIMEGKRLFGNYRMSVLNYTLLLIFSLILLLTAARGVILALIISFIFFFVFSKEKQRSIIKILPFVLFTVMIVLTYMDNPNFRIDRLFKNEEYTTMSGRTEIWVTHFKAIVDSGPVHIILGAGPGNINRISKIKWYAHSTFLDFFFSYGILGAGLLLYLELHFLIKFIKERNACVIAIYVLSIVMYSTHGSSANDYMFLLQIVLLYITKYLNSSASLPMNQSFFNKETSKIMENMPEESRKILC